MRDSQKILILLNAFVVLFLIFSASIFVYSMMNPIDNNYRSIKFGQQNKDSITSIKSNTVKLQNIENQVDFLFKEKEKTSNNSVLVNPFINLTTNRNNYSNSTIADSFLNTSLSKFGNSNTVNTGNLKSYLNNSHCYNFLFIFKEKVKTTIYKKKNSSNNHYVVENYPKIGEIYYYNFSNEASENKNYSYFDYTDTNLLYNFSLFIQIGFAFALPGLYTNRNVLKLGVL